MEEVACIEVPVDQRKRKGKDKYWIRLTFRWGPWPSSLGTWRRQG
jgi:hypothetical protein